MRLGIAGTGRIGAGHAGVLAAHPDVDEIVVHDADPVRAREVADGLGASVAVTQHDLFGRGLDGLVIATASATHPDLIEPAVAAGVPVFCEKPVALDVRRTRDVLELVTASGVPVQVGFQRRFDEGYRAARDALRSGELGELRRAHLISGDPEPSPAEFIATCGGIFRDLSVHDFDILRWVTGQEVEEVFAVGANRGDALFAAAGDVDECVGLIVLGDGSLATLQASRYNGAGYDVRMEVAGTLGTRVVGLSERSALSSAEPGVGFPSGEPWRYFRDRFGPSYAAELHAFVDVVAGRRDNPCGVDDALEAFCVAEAMELSRREHRPVRMTEIRG